MRQIRLSGRLAAVASFVKPGANVVDVGTDHGYIPVYLAQHGKAGRIIATDVRKGPLESAGRSAEKYGVSEQIEFVLSDGLTFTDGSGIDTVILAGMGGETIAGILEQAPWTQNGCRLILQPQSKIDVLSTWLSENKFDTVDGMLVREGGRIYAVMTARGADNIRSNSPAEAFVSRIYLEKRDPLLPAYLNVLIHKMAHAVSGMQKSESSSALPELSRLQSVLSGLRQVKKETEQWSR